MNKRKILLILGILLIFFISMILIFGNMYNVYKEDKEYKENNESNKVEEVEDDEKEENKINIEQTKIYNSILSRMNNANIYIDIRINNEINLIVANKGNNIYISYGDKQIIGRDNNIYLIDNIEKIIYEKKDAIIDIKDIINVSLDSDVEIYNVKKDNIDYYCEKIDELEFYFEGETVKYLEDLDRYNTYLVNNISEVENEEIFNLPIHYSIINGNNIDVKKIIAK